MKIAIAGYGALGRAAEKEAAKFDDTELVGVFTRREPALVKRQADTNLLSFSKISGYENKVDVVLNCMGSANDLPVTTPYLSKYFNVVDSFDNHASFPEYKKRIEHYTAQSKKLVLIGCGWDPGIYSLFRAFCAAVFPGHQAYTFWGEGVSRGHTNAIKNIEGVVDAVQYTVPIENAVQSVRQGDSPVLSDCDRHRRICFVVTEAGANTQRIENEIVNMEGYFKGYDTQVNFIDYESFLLEHKTEKHAGDAIVSFKDNTLDFCGELLLKMSSNPSFTARIMLSYAKAVYELSKSGKSGCLTVFDIPLSCLFESG
ncbi:MAG: diaminopimelate dehydrogenase, partial [Acutalibacteraceae bacterium]